MPFGINTSVINGLPAGSPYNGRPANQVLRELSLQYQNGSPDQKSAAVQTMQQISKLPEFTGIGWQGLAAMLGAFGGGALAAALGGGAAGTAAATAGSSSLSQAGQAIGATPSVGDVAGGTVPNLPSLPGVGGVTNPGALNTGIPTATAPTPASGLLDSIFSRNNAPTLISGGTSLLNGILQSATARGAAQTQANASTTAAQLQAKAAQDALDFEKQVYGDQTAANKPFLEAGTSALSQIQALLAPGGDLSKDFTAPTADEVRATPGYQLQLDEAMKALGRQTKGVTSGATLKAAERYASDYADTKYNADVNQALNIFQTNRNNRLNPLLTLAGFGPQAVSSGNSIGSSTSGQVGNTLTTAANAIGNAGEQSAFQTASGNVASTNALSAALQQIANLAQQREALNRSSV